MKLTTIFHWIILSLLAIMLVSCGSSEEPTATDDNITSQPPATSEIQTEPADTATAPLIPTNQVTEAATASDPGPSCSVLQDLNLRSGPSTAHRPPIRILPANSVVTPLGYTPQGFLGGTWAYVQDRASPDKGWVSAGPQYLSCTIDLTTLPSVAFDPPPPYFPKTAQTSPGPGQGFCKDGSGSEYSCVLTFSDEYLFRVQVFKNGVEQDETDGVQPIPFTVTKGDQVVYSTTENNAAYCIFGGNGPCNSWVFENGSLRWKSGSAPVESGEYKLAIDVTVNGEDSHWESFFTLNLP